MKRFGYILFILSVVTTLSSCVKDTPDARIDNQGQKTIILSIDDPDEVEITKVTTPGTTDERTFKDMFLLLFDGTTKKYKAGELVDISTNLSVNGDKIQYLKTSLAIADGDKLVVLGNTGQITPSVPTGMVVGTSTVDDINSVFTSFRWKSFMVNPDRGLPMSGELDWDSTKEHKVDMIRAVAKIEVVVKNPLDHDVTGFFVTDFSLTDHLTHPSAHNVAAITAGYPVGNIYNPTDNISFPDPYTERVSGLYASSGASDAWNPVMYIPEFPAATKYAQGDKALGDLNSDTEFDSRRFHIMLFGKKVGYYRIDLYQIDELTGQKKYLDIKRNNHYKIIINSVDSYGYASTAEAVNNPASNIEYEVQVIGDNDNLSSSNGQYALSVDRRQITLFDDNTDKLKFTLTATETTPLNLTTSYIDFVKTGTETLVDVSDYKFQIGSNRFDTSTKRIPFTVPANFTGRQEFTLVMWNAIYHTQQEAIEGNDITARLHLGNLTKEIPIVVNKVAFYYGTANCIEVPYGKSGTYSFDVMPYTTTDCAVVGTDAAKAPRYGYQNTPDNELSLPQRVQLLWSDVYPNGLKNLKITLGDKRTVSFDADATVKGNSVIGIYDMNGRLLWSYHIWVSDRSELTNQRYSAIEWASPYAITSAQTIVMDKYEMMDRNLGATSNEPPSAENGYSNDSYGMFYQWGRKDPFVGSATYNESTTFRTTYYFDGSVKPRESQLIDSSKGTIMYSILNPWVFLYNNVSPFDWIFDSTKANFFYTGRWGYPATVPSWAGRLNLTNVNNGSKAIYDPCPKGYQVSNIDAFTMMAKNPTAMVPNKVEWNMPVTALATYKGYMFYYSAVDSGPTAYLPAAGAIGQTDGALGTVGDKGFYWPVNNYFNGEQLRTSFDSSNLNFSWAGVRGGGYTVRCCKIK